ncbi:Hypothetical protein A7982_04866 [Minicystis rosea]|nr:Hypothetical protein A7982_04866 [Minicystis rosea]
MSRALLSALPLSLATAVALLSGCEEGYTASRGLYEPFQVQNGQFFSGDLPEGDKGPQITLLNSQNNLLFAGQGGKKISGNAQKGAMAVAARFTDMGSGYWSVPVGAADPATMGELTWDMSCNFSSAIPEGTHTLRFVVSDAEGNWGAPKDLDLTVQSSAPKGKVVISLRWDSPADLDLHLVNPDGSEIDPKHPNAKPIDGGTYSDDPYVFPPGTGVLNRDSNGSCTQDGLREEDIVFADAPLPGVYLMRVDMFAACSAPAANFVVTVREDGVVKQTIKGRLLDIDADNGIAPGDAGATGAGLFIGQLTY